jgi:hypothetical protein
MLCHKASSKRSRKKEMDSNVFKHKNRENFYENADSGGL